MRWTAPVLNALRQSEENHAAKPVRRLAILVCTCSTPYGNQRKITTPQGTVIPLGKRCSTPYGNQRKITNHAFLRGSPQGKVLNALRQSEENHLDVKLRLLTPFSCSTPYGNQRKITPGGQPEGEIREVCSTPYGNQRKITVGYFGNCPGC